MFWEYLICRFQRLWTIIIQEKVHGFVMNFDYFTLFKFKTFLRCNYQGYTVLCTSACAHRVVLHWCSLELLLTISSSFHIVKVSFWLRVTTILTCISEFRDLFCDLLCSEEEDVFSVGLGDAASTTKCNAEIPYVFWFMLGGVLYELLFLALCKDMHND